MILAARITIGPELRDTGVVLSPNPIVFMTRAYSSTHGVQKS